MRLYDLIEADHYVQVGHNLSGGGIIWFMEAGGQIHHWLAKDGDEAHADSDRYYRGRLSDSIIAKGRADPDSNKLSLMVMSELSRQHPASDREIDFIVRKLQRQFADYAIWYFPRYRTSSKDHGERIA